MADTTCQWCGCIYSPDEGWNERFCQVSCDESWQVWSDVGRDHL
jgi:hypothetical protein